MRIQKIEKQAVPLGTLSWKNFQGLSSEDMTTLSTVWMMAGHHVRSSSETALLLEKRYCVETL